MLLITHDRDLAERYSLFIDKETGFPCIRIRKTFLQGIETLRQDVVNHIARRLDLPSLWLSFSSSIKTPFWGFCETLEKIDEDPVWVTYRLNLPIINKISKEKCGECGGTRKDDKFASMCHKCGGTGKKETTNWDEAYALTASFSLLLQYLITVKDTKAPIGTTTKNTQLMSIETAVTKKLDGCPIGGSFSVQLIDLLKQKGPNYRFIKATEAMLSANKYMWHYEPGADDLGRDARTIRAWQYIPGNLILDVPGHACGIHPSSQVHTIPDGRGVEFNCHHVDNPLQQLTIITGLAAVCEMAKELP